MIQTTYPKHRAQGVRVSNRSETTSFALKRHPDDTIHVALHDAHDSIGMAGDFPDEGWELNDNGGSFSISDSEATELYHALGEMLGLEARS